MSKRKRKRRIVNIGEYISADELRNYVSHAELSDLNFLENLISQRRRDLRAKEGASEFPIYQRLEKQLLEDEKKIRRLIKQQNGTQYAMTNELTPGFLYGYFRDYPTDAYFEVYSDWQQTIRQLNWLQEKIGRILVIRDAIVHAGFKIVQTHYSQRSLSTYLYLPMTQISAFQVVFAQKYDVSGLEQLNPENLRLNDMADRTFSIRISDHVNGTFYNQTTQQREHYTKATIDIYI